ncbi:MAG: hypothetical protein GY812_01105 [Actinomycetia bacterium]|nr:hypothetical protein [Actinomycetes bacterium]
MGAPEYVPVDRTRTLRSYSSPPRRPGSWKADRPGEVVGRQPEGERLGTPGPDQGYAITLANRLSGGLKLTDGEHEADVLAGGAAIAMKRSGLFGRGPMLADVEAALTPWGYFDAAAPDDLVAVRRSMFEEIHHAHHYVARRALVDSVPGELLTQSLDDIEVAYAEGWRDCLDLEA